jgi:hypothetical protein
LIVDERNVFEVEETGSASDFRWKERMHSMRFRLDQGSPNCSSCGPNTALLYRSRTRKLKCGDYIFKYMVKYTREAA